MNFYKALNPNAPIDEIEKALVSFRKTALKHIFGNREMSLIPFWLIRRNICTMKCPKRIVHVIDNISVENAMQNKNKMSIQKQSEFCHAN